jgi:hypothetical protein
VAKFVWRRLATSKSSTENFRKFLLVTASTLLYNIEDCQPLTKCPKLDFVKMDLLSERNNIALSIDVLHEFKLSGNTFFL